MEDATTRPGSTRQTPGGLMGVGILLALSNFMAVLDSTIANVSVPTIAGNLGVSVGQGTWTITSYAVAEAIMVPLTGWLVQRFGAIRMFVSALCAFGVCSALCGIAGSLESLIFFRVIQGFAGGPLMPVSQMLLLGIFPPDKRGTAMALWAMTTLIAPIAGPLLGGWICDNYHWSWIFLINVPVAAAASVGAWTTLRPYETPSRKVPVDYAGLTFMVVWVGALQIMLDEGKDADWFSSPLIIALALVAAAGFLVFLIWELTEEHPIVHLRVFRHRGFTMPCIVLALTIGSVFASIVLSPLWMQVGMGYTAFWSRAATAFSGLSALVVAPVAAKMLDRVDTRAMVTAGILGFALVCLLRSGFTPDVDFRHIAAAMMLQGLFMPLCFMPVMNMGLANLSPEELPSATGLNSFVRTLSGAISTSAVTTLWQDQAVRNHAGMASLLHGPEQIIARMPVPGAAHGQPMAGLDLVVQSQAVMLATNQVFVWIAAILLVSAAAVWLAPKSRRKVAVQGH